LTEPGLRDIFCRTPAYSLGDTIPISLFLRGR
jgi:hypothetical protein